MTNINIIGDREDFERELKKLTTEISLSDLIEYIKSEIAKIGCSDVYPCYVLIKNVGLTLRSNMGIQFASDLGGYTDPYSKKVFINLLGIITQLKQVYNKISLLPKWVRPLLGAKRQEVAIQKMVHYMVVHEYRHVEQLLYMGDSAIPRVETWETRSYYMNPMEWDAWLVQCGIKLPLWVFFGPKG